MFDEEKVRKKDLGDVIRWVKSMNGSVSRIPWSIHDGDRRLGVHALEYTPDQVAFTVI